jgi:hypothetical protein
MRCVTVRPPPRCQTLVGERVRARVMRARMAVIVVIAGGKDAIIAAAINHHHSRQRRHRSCWLNPIVAAIDNDAIAAVDDHHHCCHTVDDNNCQKPVVIVRCQRWQRRSLSMEAAGDGDRGNCGLCRWRSSSTEVVVGWMDNDAMALLTMASSADIRSSTMSVTTLILCQIV